MSQQKYIVSTPGAPAAIGPYSQGIAAGGFVFTAMQIPLDPTTGEMVSGSVETETWRVLQNLQAVLEAANSSLDKVVKVTVYLADLADFGAVNEVYATFFSHEQPARGVVGVSALPKGARVAVEMIALA